MADGTLYIETAIDTDGFVAGGKDVEAAAKRMAQTVKGIGASAKIALKKQAESFVQMNQQYSRQSQKVEELKNKLKELENVKVETKEYQKLGTELKDLESQFEAVEQKKRDWIQMGFPVDTGAFKELEKQLDEIWASMEKIQVKQQQMKAEGSAYVNPKTSQKYQGTEARIAVEEQKLVNMNNKLGNSYEALKQKVADYGKKNNSLINISKRLQKAVSMVGASIKGMGTALKKVGSTIKSMVSALKKAISAMTGFHKASDRSRTSLGSGLKQILKYTIGIRSLFVLANRLRSALVDGFKNLAQYSDKTNASLSLLMSSLTRVKNSFATAFAPILSVVAPIMSRFIDMISKGATYVGMFFASLTGQDSFTRAKSVQQDYAASLDKTSKSSKKAAKATKDAAKDAKGSLAPWDELNVIQTNLADSLDTTADMEIPELTPQDMFEEVPIKSSVKNFADQIKKMIKDQDWNGIGKYLGQQINKGLKKLNKAIRWDTVGNDITKGVDAITGIFNALVDEIDWEYMGNTAGEGLNTLFKTLNQLMEKTDWKNLGKGFAEFANGLMDTVEWDEVGAFFGNKIMMLWDILSGAAHELNWEDVGVSIGEALNAAFAKISFSEISDTLATGINGLFESLDGFTETFDWSGFADNVKDGINTFLKKTDWKGNGEALDAFLTEFLGALLDAAEGTDWEEFGKGIGDFLSEVDWEAHFLTMLDILKEVLGGIWEGLGETSAGKFIEAIAIFKLGTKLMPFVNKIVEFFTGKTAGQKLTGAIKSWLGKAIADSTSEGFISSLGGVLKNGLSKLGGVVKGALPLLGKGLLWGGGSVLAAVGGFKFGEELSIQLFGGERKSVKDFVQDNIIGYQSGDITGAFNEFFKEVISGIQPISTDDLQVFEDLKNTVLQLIRMDDLEGSEGYDLLGYLDELSANGTSSSEAMQGLKDKLSELGVSSEAFETAMQVIQSSLEAVGTEADTTKDKASEMMQRINTADFTGIQESLSGFNTDLQAVDFARLVTETANAVDEMGGIWENGRQVLGEKALQIYQEISAGLEPDQDGYYHLANGQMVQYGKGIEDYEDNARNTLDATLRSAIEEALPDGFELYYKKGENEIAGYTEGLESKKSEIEGAADKLLQGAAKKSKTTASKEGKETGENLGKGLVTGIESTGKSVNDTLMDLVDDDIKAPMRSGLQLGSPSKLFGQYAVWCGEGFANALSGAFSGAFSFFRDLGANIDRSIGDLSVIGHNAVIGLNNGMVRASDILFDNARKIANGISNIFRNALKIHSPSKVMEELGGYTMEGFQAGMEGWMDKITGLAEKLSGSIQSAMQISVPEISVPVTLDPKTAGIYPRQIPVMAQGVVLPPKTVNYSGGTMAGVDTTGIKKVIMDAIKESRGTEDNGLTAAIQSAMSGMAVYADGQIIGYLQKKNSEYRNMNGGVGLFET